MNNIKYLGLIVVTILLLVTCKKEFHFKHKDITETDGSGNYVGNINPNDWQLRSIADLSSFEKSILLQIPIHFSVPNDDTSKLDTIDVNLFGCIDTFQFNMVAFPNPMQNSKLQLRINSNLPYKRVYILITDKKGNFITGTYSSNSIEIVEYDMPPLVNRDFIFHYLFITEDNCAYYGRGNVIGSKK